MKTNGFRKSDHVEVDCLGKRVNLNSHEAKAAFACQDEVNAYRQQRSDSAVNNASKAGQLNFEGAAEMERGMVNYVLDARTLSYITAKSEQKKSSKPESYKDRVHDYIDFMEH